MNWTPEALKKIEQAPFFLRAMVKKLAEKKAEAAGIAEITPEHLTRWKNEGMSGVEMPAEPGGIFWTKKAKEMLETVPEFLRPMTQKIAEEIAKEGGHLEVNSELFSKIEGMGLKGEAAPFRLKWTEGALRMLQEKIKETPPMALEFVTQMLREDAEEIALSKGMAEMTEGNLAQIWSQQDEEIKWTPEAWKRLQTSPEFVRSGIKKAAERRARRAQSDTITSEMLTRFRNEAMMKAVIRIRQFGYNTLTFDAFEDALAKTKRLKENPEAPTRLGEIKAFMDKRGEVGLLDREMMDKMKKYLQGDEKKLL
ncbi:MAG: PCP reductase family protein [Nitrospirae bacterium]|nr:PCP reductase family protein [Nitrospirota bacterium]